MSGSFNHDDDYVEEVGEKNLSRSQRELDDCNNRTGRPYLLSAQKSWPYCLKHSTVVKSSINLQACQLQCSIRVAWVPMDWVTTAGAGELWCWVRRQHSLRSLQRVSPTELPVTSNLITKPQTIPGGPPSQWPPPTPPRIF